MANRIHTLKTWPQYYSAVLAGRKTFELRKNDRAYSEGDCLVLQEYDPERGSYTGEMTAVLVTYISDCAPFLPPGMVCMSIEPYPAPTGGIGNAE